MTVSDAPPSEEIEVVTVGDAVLAGDFCFWPSWSRDTVSAETSESTLASSWAIWVARLCDGQP